MQTQECRLGTFEAIGFEGGRVNFTCDWEVTPAALKVFDEVAQGIDGLEFVIRPTDETISFTLICNGDLDGEKLFGIRTQFEDGLIAYLNALTEEQVQTVTTYTRDLDSVVAEAMAVHSPTRDLDRRAE